MTEQSKEVARLMVAAQQLEACQNDLISKHEDIPTCLPTIINLLKAGNFDDAERTYRWEADKLNGYEYRDLVSTLDSIFSKVD